MKNGIKRSAKMLATKDPESSAIDVLPIKFLNNVLSFLPAYQFFTSQTIARVSRKWLAATQSEKMSSFRTFAAILQACREDSRVAVHLLSDINVLEKISFKQILEIIACSQELTNALLETPSLFANIDFYTLFLTGLSNLRFSQAMTASPILCHKLERGPFIGFNLFWELCLKYSEIAKVAVKNEMLCNRLPPMYFKRIIIANDEFAEYFFVPARLEQRDSNELTALCLAKEEFAQTILGKPNLKTKLQRPHVREIACKYLSCAHTILGNHEFRTLLRNKDLAEIASYHPDFAMDYIKSRKFSIEEIATMGKRHIQITNVILRNPEFYYQLNSQTLCILGSCHAAIIKLILKDYYLCEKLCAATLISFCEHDVEIAQHIFDNSQLLEKLSTPHLVGLGTKHLFIAEYLISSCELKKQLTVADLVSLGKVHSRIAEEIFKTPELFNLFLVEATLAITMRSLVNLCELHLFLAKHVLKTPALFNQLFPSEIESLGVKHPTLIPTILDNHEITKWLSSIELTELGLQHPHCAKRILNTPELSKDLSTQNRELLTCRVKFVDTVMKTAIKLNTTSSQVASIRPAI